MGKEQRMEPTGGKARGQNFPKLKYKRVYFYLSNYGCLMFLLFRLRGTESDHMCMREKRNLKGRGI